MKILEAFGEPIQYGGQEAFVFNVLAHMDFEGVDCLTAYQWDNEKYKQMVEEKGGKAYALRLPFEPGKSREKIRKPFRDFLTAHPYDVVHIHSGSISVLVIMASVAKKCGVRKVIVHSHSCGEKDNLKHKLLRFMASIPLSHSADVYCACSKEAAEWKFMPKYAAQTHIITNGVDLDKYRYALEKRKTIRNQLAIPETAFVVGHIGRFAQEKNHHFLIDVFEAVEKQDQDALLLLVGDGEERGNIEAIVKEKGLQSHVIFTGNVNNVQDYLQAMDVFIFPSLYEGLGISMIEAQAAGLPVVASNRVPNEVKISEAFTFLPLEERLEKWAVQVLQYRSFQRTDQSPAVRRAGYDIVNTTMEVLKIYQCKS